jgi:hypothetical protein
MMPVSRLIDEGRTRGRHDMRGGDAMDVLVLQRTWCADEQANADVKSCGPGVPVLTSAQRVYALSRNGGNLAGPRGDHV